jgi:hypothetical protein
MKQFSRNIQSLASVAAVAGFGGLVAGCADSGSGSWQGTVQDSSGVQIVTSPEGGIWDDAARWTVTEELRIGVDEGDPNLQFGRVMGLDVDDSGQIHILDSQASHIRSFSPEGAYVRTIARRGGGPGELSQGAQGLFVSSDQAIVVPDLGNRRIARFDLEGTPLESPTINPMDGIPLFWAVSKDRTIYSQVRRIAMPGMNVPEGSEPMDYILARGEGGEVTDTVASFPSGETIGAPGAGGMPTIRLFSPELVWAAAGEAGIVTALNSEYSLNLYDGNGDLVTIIRRTSTPRVITTGEQSAFRESMMKSFEGQVPPQMAQQIAQNVQFAEHWPVLAQLFAGPENTIWVQRTDPDAALKSFAEGADLQTMTVGSMNWDVFDASGRFMGALTMPEGFAPRRVVGDSVYGLHNDEFGVQRVMRLRVVRPA